MTTTKALTDDEVGILLTSAIHAPSMHNTQPWRFEVHGAVVDVLFDEERTLPVEDPANRLTRIGLGAAAFNLRVAAAMLGHESTVALEPDPHRQDIAARIFLARRDAPVPGLSPLYGELRRRHTYRGPLLAQPVPPKVLALLDEATRSERAQLDWLDDAQLALLGGMLRQVDAEDLHDEDRLHERLRWIGGDRRDDGVPDAALGPVPAGPAQVRDLAAGFDRPERGHGWFETHPAIAVLSTVEDDARAWLRAGLALERMLLTATSYDLVASFLNQLLERPVPRFEVRELIGGRGWPQLVIRLGYPDRPGEHTPRRDWQASFDQWFQ